MKRTASVLAAIGALFAALPAFGQDDPAPDPAPTDTTIVVTGEKGEPANSAVVDQARDLSRIGRYQLYEEGLPRFDAPLCPRIFGADTIEQAREIVSRIRENAARIEVEVATGPCVPNVIIAFVEDGGSFVKRLARGQSEIFRLIAAPERAEVMEEGAPVRVWNNIGLVWTGNGDPPIGWPKARPSVRGQLTRPSMPEGKIISSAAVLFEREAVKGLSMTQIADYALMRALTHTRPATGEEPMATILALFAGDTPPLEMTSFDIGYLRSLYRGPINQSAASRFVRIRSELDRARKESTQE